MKDISNMNKLILVSPVNRNREKSISANVIIKNHFKKFSALSQKLLENVWLKMMLYHEIPSYILYQKSSILFLNLSPK